MKILTVVGARPQFIKASVVSRAISECTDVSGIEEVMVHTGQHYDEKMSNVFFEELGIRRPDYDLGIGSMSHGAQTGRMLEAIEAVIKELRPRLVLVYGDTNSTLAGALAASKLNVKLAHVEAGLRSFNMRMPEEVNRVLTDRVSDLLLCPTDASLRNLSKEGFVKSFCKSSEPVSGATLPLAVNTGDVMYDAALNFSELSAKKSRIIDKLALAKGGFVLATIHRAENTDDTERLRAILDGLCKIADETKVVFPIHPRTKSALKKAGLEGMLGKEDMRIIEPVSYLDMVALEKNSRLIVTDSGGIQKEAYFYGVPCITTRDETEWVETLEGKANTLVGADAERLFRAFKEAGEPSGRARGSHYGIGEASKNILKTIREVL